MITYTGPVAAFGVLGGAVPPGCTTTGATITCPVPVVEAAGLYNPDTLNLVLAGHTASNMCFATGLTDSGCGYVQQLTWVS